MKNCAVTQKNGKKEKDLEIKEIKKNKNLEIIRYFE